jgi:hypothetical protein
MVTRVSSSILKEQELNNKMLEYYVIIGVLSSMFIIFVLYIRSPINIFGRDLDSIRSQYNLRLERASRQKKAGLVKSYAQSRDSSEYSDMIKNFQKGQDYLGPNGGTKPLYSEDTNFIYNAFNVAN